MQSESTASREHSWLKHTEVPQKPLGSVAIYTNAFCHWDLESTCFCVLTSEQVTSHVQSTNLCCTPRTVHVHLYLIFHQICPACLMAGAAGNFWQLHLRSCICRCGSWFFGRLIRSCTHGKDTSLTDPAGLCFLWNLAGSHAASVSDRARDTHVDVSFT